MRPSPPDAPTRRTTTPAVQRTASRVLCSFGDEFYELVKAALKPDGVLCAQGECVWLHLDLIKEMMAFCRSKFPVVEYGVVQIPTCALQKPSALSSRIASARSSPTLTHRCGGSRMLPHASLSTVTPTQFRSDPAGQIGFLCCAKSPRTSFTEPLRLALSLHRWAAVYVVHSTTGALVLCCFRLQGARSRTCANPTVL